MPGKEHVWRELEGWGGIWGQTRWVLIPAWGSRPCFLHLHKEEMLSAGMKHQEWRNGCKESPTESHWESQLMGQ